jgi:hypothetical protein
MSEPTSVEIEAAYLRATSAASGMSAAFGQATLAVESATRAAADLKRALDAAGLDAEHE